MKTPRASRKGWFFHFGLRRMLLALTMLCLVAGWYVNACVTQERAVRALRSEHGYVTYDYQLAAGTPGSSQFARARSHVPEWLIRHLGVDWFHNVVTVSAFQCTPESLGHVSQLRGVTSIHIHSSELTGEAMAALCRCSSLEQVEFSRSHITAEGWSELVRLPALRELTLSHMQVTEQDLVHLEKVHRLSSLHFNGVVVPDAGLDSIQKMRRLEELDLGITSISARALHRLTGMRRLNHIQMGHGMFTDPKGSSKEDWESLRRALPNCQVDCAVE